LHRLGVPGLVARQDRWSGPPLPRVGVCGRSRYPCV